MGDHLQRAIDLNNAAVAKLQTSLLTTDAPPSRIPLDGGPTAMTMFKQALALVGHLVAPYCQQEMERQQQQQQQQQAQSPSPPPPPSSKTRRRVYMQDINSNIRLAAVKIRLESLFQGNEEAVESSPAVGRQYFPTSYVVGRAVVFERQRNTSTTQYEHNAIAGSRRPTAVHRHECFDHSEYCRAVPYCDIAPAAAASSAAATAGAADITASCRRIIAGECSWW